MFIRYVLLIFLLNVCASSVFATTSTAARFPNPFYAGFSIGYGSTTWHELIDPEQNIDTALATPIKVNEGGFTWGPFVGFEFSPYFALESHYTDYPKARVFFSKYSVYDVKEITSRTESFNVIAKVMAPFFNTPARFYADAGAGVIHRSDKLASTRWRLGPSFGAGFNYLVMPHLLAELGFQYYTGWGKSEVDPVNDYIPFLYSVQFRLAYRFGLPNHAA